MRVIIFVWVGCDIIGYWVELVTRQTTTTTTTTIMAWHEHDTMDNIMKSIMTVTVIIGLDAVDFI